MTEKESINNLKIDVVPYNGTTGKSYYDLDKIIGAWIRSSISKVTATV